MIEKDYQYFREKIHNSSQMENQLKRVPVSVELELTRRCNLKCIHCYIGDARWESSKDEMSTSQIKDLLDLLYLKDTLWICFTGGEPLTRPDFKELWKYAKEKGFLITLFTNATLIDADLIEFLERYRPFNIDITLYGASEECYQKVTGVKGLYQKCLKGISLLSESKLKWCMKAICLKENLSELDDIKKIAKEYGVPFRFDGSINPSIGEGNSAGMIPCTSRLSEEELINMELADPTLTKDINRLLELNKGDFSRKKELYGCGAGESGAYIDAYGNMQMCVLADYLKKPLFSADQNLENSFNQTWDFFGEVRERKLREDSPCLDCDIAIICNNCPPFAYLENGDEHSAVEWLCKNTHQKAERLKIKHQCTHNL